MERTPEEIISAQLEKSPFYYRPLCLWTGVFLCTLVACFLPGAWSLFLFVPLAARAAFCFWRARSPRVVLPWLILSAAVAAFAVFGIYTLSRSGARAMLEDYSEAEEAVTDTEEKAEGYDESGALLTVRVISEYYCEVYGSAYYVELIEADGVSLNGHAVLEATEGLYLVPFDTVTCRAKLSEYETGVRITDRMYAISDDILLTAEVNGAVSVSDEAKCGFFYFVHTLREWLSERMSSRLGAGAAGFAAAVLFGDKSGLARSAERNVAAVGISHLLAVSGSHLAVMALVIGFLLERVRIGKRKRIVAVALISLFYAALCGFSPPVLRSALMLCFTTAIVMWGYPSDPINALFASALVTCLFQPTLVLDAGMLLSFAATLGVIMASEIGFVRKVMRPASKSLVIRALLSVLASLFTTLASTLITAPLSALFFGEFSLAALFVNLVAIPCVSIALILAAVLCLVSNIPLLGAAVAWGFDLIYRFLVGGTAALATSLPMTVSLSYPFVTYIFILCACGYIFVRLCGIVRREAAFVPLIVAVFLFAACIGVYGVGSSDRTEAVFTVDGRNEGFVLYDGGKTLICDMSDGAKALSLSSVALTRDGYYRTRIDGYMLTHYHARHASTALKLMTVYYLDTVYLPIPEELNEEQIAFSIERMAEKYGSKVVYYERGRVLNFGKLGIISDTAKVNRSTHPAITISISTDGDRLTYWSSAVTESELLMPAAESAAASGTLIIGAHGPMEKEAAVIYADLSETDGYIAPGCVYGAAGSYGDGFTRLASDAEGKGTYYFIFGEKGDP